MDRLHNAVSFNRVSMARLADKIVVQCDVSGEVTEYSNQQDAMPDGGDKREYTRD